MILTIQARFDIELEKSGTLAMCARNIDQLFLRVCGDLRQRLGSNDEYEILKSAGLLRQLLLDDLPLLHQVNMTRKLKISFEISDFNPPPIDPSLLFWSIEDGLNPATGLPWRARKKVNLSEFLSIKVLRSNGTDFTIKDIILFEANVMGGVHAGAPKTEKERELMKIGVLYAGGLPASLRQLKSISQVVLAASRPLEAAI